MNPFLYDLLDLICSKKKYPFVNTFSFSRPPQTNDFYFILHFVSYCELMLFFLNGPFNIDNQKLTELTTPWVSSAK